MSSTIGKSSFGQEPAGAFNLRPPDYITDVERFPRRRERVGTPLSAGEVLIPEFSRSQAVWRTLLR